MWPRENGPGLVEPRPQTAQKRLASSGVAGADDRDESPPSAPITPGRPRPSFSATAPGAGLSGHLSSRTDLDSESVTPAGSMNGLSATGSTETWGPRTHAAPGTSSGAHTAGPGPPPKSDSGGSNHSKRDSDTGSAAGDRPALPARARSFLKLLPENRRDRRSDADSTAEHPQQQQQQQPPPRRRPSAGRGAMSRDQESSASNGQPMGPPETPAQLPARARSFTRRLSRTSSSGSGVGSASGNADSTPATAAASAASAAAAATGGKRPAGTPAEGQRGGGANGILPLKDQAERCRPGSIGERQQKAVVQNFVKLLRDLERETEHAAASRPVMFPFPEALQMHIIGEMARVRLARCPGVIEAPGFKQADMEPIFQRMADGGLFPVGYLALTDLIEGISPGDLPERCTELRKRLQEQEQSAAAVAAILQGENDTVPPLTLAVVRSLSASGLFGAQPLGPTARFAAAGIPLESATRIQVYWRNFVRAASTAIPGPLQVRRLDTTATTERYVKEALTWRWTKADGIVSPNTTFSRGVLMEHIETELSKKG